MRDGYGCFHCAPFSERPRVRNNSLVISRLIVVLALAPAIARAEGLPTFRVTVGDSSYTLAGRDPAAGGTSTIPATLVAVQLSFAGQSAKLAPDAAAIVRSPVFAKFPFPGGATQY